MMIEPVVVGGKSLCPECGAAIQVLLDSLSENEGDNYIYARVIIANCNTCAVLCWRWIMEGR